jgi:hypothetical protein
MIVIKAVKHINGIVTINAEGLIIIATTDMANKNVYIVAIIFSNFPMFFLNFFESIEINCSLFPRA